ncbi:MAG: L-histidine N-alpha-methyltransferase [Myxococcota bacterium]|jgi:L-histidine N-alpha-methyltransferase
MRVSVREPAKFPADISKSLGYHHREHRCRVCPATTARLTITEASQDSAPTVELLQGLGATPRRIAFKYFYDAVGSRLFENILAQPEYYPARVEQKLLTTHGRAMAEAIGPHQLIIEYGAGNAHKTEALLDHLVTPAGYVPIDIVPDQLERTASRLRDRYATVDTWPLLADFTQPFTLPAPAAGRYPRTAYFPGCTIWNLPADAGRRLLARIAQQVGPGGKMLIAVDHAKAPSVLELAYDDPAGATAAFNRNVLTHVNRLFDGNFDPTKFVHRAKWVPSKSRMEMSLVSLVDQVVTVSGRPFTLAKDTAILTELSYKLTDAAFADLCSEVGFTRVCGWRDPGFDFSVELLTVTGRS